MYGHNAKGQRSGNVSSPLAASAHHRGRLDKNKPPEREPSNLDTNTEKPTPQIPALKEMRIWMLGGIREGGEVASCCSWNGESYVQQKGREGGLLLGQPVRHETDIHNAHGFSRPRSGCASVAIKGRLWLLGGFSEKHGMLSSVISRDKKTPFWRVEPKMTKRRDGLCCVAYDEGAFMSEGSIIVLGGNNGAAMTNTCERAALVDLGGGNWGLEEWEELPKMFSRRGNFSAVHFKHEESNDHQIYAIGGYSDGKGRQRLTDSMERFDIAASQWVVEKSTGVARAGHAAALHNGRIMLGGGTDGLNALNSCEQFDPREGRWRQTVSLKKARVGHSFVEHCGKLYAIGGRSYLDEVQLSDIESMQICETRVKDTGLAAELQSETHQVTEFLHVVEVFEERAMEWKEVTCKLPEIDTSEGRAAVDRFNFGCCVW